VGLAPPVSETRTFTGIDARRSTRIERAVPLVILAQDRFGQSFEESTYAISLNLHGCCYPSRHNYRLGTWVGLQMADPGDGNKVSTVRAQVRSITVPQHTRDLYQVGVELETPANVWGITVPPEDWMSGRESRVSTTELPLEENEAAPAQDTTLTLDPELPEAGEMSLQATAEPQDVSIAAPEPPPAPPVAEVPEVAAKPVGEPARPRMVISPDQLVAALRGKLQRAAEKAVQEALTASLQPALHSALRAIEETSRLGVRQVVGAAAQAPQGVGATASKEELLRAMDSRLAEHRTHAEEVVERLQEMTAATEASLEEAKKLAEKFARETEPKLVTRLEETMARGREGFEAAAARAADRQLLRLMEDSHRMMKETSAQLEARVAEARAVLQTAAGATLDEFRRQAEVQVDLVASEVTQRVTSSLGALEAENRAACESRRETLEQDVTRAAEQSSEQFRTGIKAFLYSCLVAAVSAVDQHSRATLEGLATNPGAPRELPPDLAVPGEPKPDK